MVGKLFAIAAALVAAGCIESTSVQCGFGLCPAGSQCDEAAKACIPPGCGNNVVEGTEQCDGTVDTNQDCIAFGYYAPKGLACSKECTFDTSACTGGTCGDHAVNGPEVCDGLPPIGATCGTFGFEIGRLGCTVDCAPAFGGCQHIGWQPGRGNAPDELHAVWGATPDEIWAVGRGGNILHGVGSVSDLWQTVPSPTTNDLNGVWGTAANDIYAVGAAGTILHYDGASWTQMTSGTTANLNAISGTRPASDMWIVGDGGTILHSSTTNVAWAAETSGVGVNLEGVWAEGTVTAVAVGQAATAGNANPTALYRNSGTWTPMTTQTIVAPGGVTVSLDAVWGSASGFIAVGTATNATSPPHGTVLQVNLATSTTWGFTGQSLTSSDLKSVWGVFTPSRVDVFIGGNFGALLHYDATPGPAHFHAYESNTTRSIRGLWGVGPAFVRAATAAGLVHEFNGTDLVATDIGSTTPGKSLSAVYYDTATNIGVAAGEAGQLVLHDNAGWGTMSVLGSPNFQWNGAWGTGPNVFLAGGGPNGLVVSNNDGVSWGGSTLTGQAWTALWGLSATDVYAVGAGGIFARYTGAWTQLAPVPGGKTLNGVWASSDTDVFAVGAMGTIMHYDGANWTPQSSGVPTNIALNGVWGTASNDVFAVGGAGTIVHYDGTKWRRLVSNTGQDLYAVRGTERADVFVGGRGTLLHWNGINWSPMESGIGDVYGMWISAGDSLLVGNVPTVTAGLEAAGTVFERTPLPAAEVFCGDPWDNDGDGAVDCGDTDCAQFAACLVGGPCGPTTPIACGATVLAASTFTGTARLDDLPCLDHSTPGPEASYRVLADHDGQITVTLTEQSGMLDLVMLDSFDDASADPAKRRVSCNPAACIAAPPASGTRTLTFAAKAGEVYYVLVDGPANTGESFDLAVDCP